MTRRWVVTDIDGTITDERGSIHLAAVEAIRKLETEGTAVGLVSGRPYFAVRILGEYLGVTGPLVAENGGIGFFAGQEFVLGSRANPDSVARVLIQRHGLAMTWDSQYRRTDCAFDRDGTIDALLAQSVTDLQAVDVHVSSIMVHLSAKGVNKGSGLRHWCRQFGIDDAAVAVSGDADSDLTLFEEFSCSFAPSNCTEALAARARFRASLPFGAGFSAGIDFLRRNGWL